MWGLDKKPDTPVCAVKDKVIVDVEGKALKGTVIEVENKLYAGWIYKVQLDNGTVCHVVGSTLKKDSSEK